jgi:hypothetical protein
MKHSNLKQKLMAMIVACFAAMAPMSAQVPQACPLAGAIGKRNQTRNF